MILYVGDYVTLRGREALGFQRVVEIIGNKVRIQTGELIEASIIHIRAWKRAADMENYIRLFFS